MTDRPDRTRPSILDGVNFRDNLENRTFRRLPLFVYGTLLRGEERGEILAQYPSTPARVRGTLYDAGAWPALHTSDPFGGGDYLRPGDTWVQGELVDVPPRLLPRLDDIEGVDHHFPEHSLFLRTRVRARAVWPWDTLAWVYTFNADTGKLRPIADGSWRGRNLVDNGNPRLDALVRIAAEVDALDDRPVHGWNPEAPGDNTWGGAGLIVRSGLIPPLGLDRWGAPHQVHFATTPHARAVAWLLMRLGAALAPLSAFNKYEFYRGVADAAAAEGTAGQRTALQAGLRAAAALSGDSTLP